VEQETAAAAAAAAAAALSPDDKKRRALMKKLTAIEQLKAKKAAGEKLELTQHKKLERSVTRSSSPKGRRRGHNISWGSPSWRLEWQGVLIFYCYSYYYSEAEIRGELAALDLNK
jgi:hypothetical protein